MNRRLLLGEVLKYKLPVGFEYEVPYKIYFNLL